MFYIRNTILCYLVYISFPFFNNLHILFDIYTYLQAILIGCDIFLIILCNIFPFFEVLLADLGSATGAVNGLIGLVIIFLGVGYLISGTKLYRLVSKFGGPKQKNVVLVKKVTLITVFSSGRIYFPNYWMADIMN